MRAGTINEQVLRSKPVRGTGTPHAYHEMSCFVMLRRCGGLSSIAFRSLRAPVLQAGTRTLFRAYRVPARPPVSAPARFARLIAPAREADAGHAGRTFPVRFFGVFPRRREREGTGPADAASSCPIIAHFLSSQASFGNYFMFSERIVSSGRKPDAAEADGCIRQPLAPKRPQGSSALTGASPAASMKRRSKVSMASQPAAAPRCSASAKVHAPFRPNEGFRQQGGVFDREPRQPRQRTPERRRHLVAR